MQLFLDSTALLAQPRRWAALLRDATTGGNRSADAQLVEHHLGRHFASAGKVLVLRRRAPTDTADEQYVLRPPDRAVDAVGGRFALVCRYEEARRALRIVALEAVTQAAKRESEQVFAGEIALASSTLRPAYCDPAAVRFLRALPYADEALRLPTAHWREYLDWRRRLAEAKALESCAYTRVEPRREGVVRFHLGDSPSLAQLRQRWLDEELYVATGPAGEHATGAFLRVVAPLRPGPSAPAAAARLAVDVDFAVPDPAVLGLPATGVLRVAIEGELASLEVQANGLRRFTENHAANPHLADWLFDIRRAQLPAGQAPSPAFDTALNPEQQTNVAQTLATDDLRLLWGPPGTAKTTVIAEICSQFARRGQRVLVASQANLAVDQALRRLPALPHVRPVWLSTARRREGVAGNPAHFLRHWLGTVREAARRQAAREPDAVWQKPLSRWADRLGTEAGVACPRDVEELYVRHANIVGATCGETGKPEFVASPRFSSRFDLAIVDEVSKATPPELLLPMLLGRRILLVGDPRQLPPMFRDEAFEQAVEDGELTRADVDRFRSLVTASLFASWFQHAPAPICGALRRQYRMHPQIMAAVNHFYADQPLLAGDGAPAMAGRKAHRLTARGPRGAEWLTPGQQVLWLDTTERPAGAAGDERLGASRFNRFEAEVCARVVLSLLAASAGAPLDLALISFYRAQVGLLRDRLRAEPAARDRLDLGRNVNTVDQFQGSERDIVIVNLVRSGPQLTGEFARDFRRINVACSRARQLLIIVGSAATFASAAIELPATQRGRTVRLPVYGLILEQIRRHGGLRSALALGTSARATSHASASGH